MGFGWGEGYLGFRPRRRFSKPRLFLRYGNFDRASGFQHGQSDQAKGNHVHEEFLVKGVGCLAIPGSL
jgi:hypothetical protein